jgi:hypothetical protein
VLVPAACLLVFAGITAVVLWNRGGPQAQRSRFEQVRATK